jgi:hypothetical protein
MFGGDAKRTHQSEIGKWAAKIFAATEPETSYLIHHNIALVWSADGCAWC